MTLLLCVACEVIIHIAWLAREVAGRAADVGDYVYHLTNVCYIYLYTRLSAVMEKLESS